MVRNTKTLVQWIDQCTKFSNYFLLSNFTFLIIQIIYNIKKNVERLEKRNFTTFVQMTLLSLRKYLKPLLLIANQVSIKQPGQKHFILFLSLEQYSLPPLSTVFLCLRLCFANEINNNWASNSIRQVSSNWLAQSNSISRQEIMSVNVFLSR